MRQPSTYKEWLARLFSTNSPESMAEAAHNAAALCPDKKKARADIAKVITEKYTTELSRGRENSIVEKAVKNKFNIISKSLFGSNIEAMLGYVRQRAEEVARITKHGIDCDCNTCEAVSL